jgi:hypothetical protein
MGRYYHGKSILIPFLGKRRRREEEDQEKEKQEQKEE